MSPAALRNHTCKDLAQMAKRRGVLGWHSMRKDQLVRALLDGEAKQAIPRSRVTATSAARSASKVVAKAAAKTLPAPNKPKHPHVAARLNQIMADRQRAKNLTTSKGAKNGREAADRLVAIVRDPFWLHVYWELSRQSVARAQASLGQRWHTAHPVLRLFTVTGSEEAPAADSLLRTIVIHGNVNNWYVDVPDPPACFRFDIGYLAADGTHHAICRSNVVTTPPASARDTLDENWTEIAENFDKIYALNGGYSPEGTSQELRELLEERLRRPMGAPVVTRFGHGLNPLDRHREFSFDVDAEMIIYGTTEPSARVMLMGEPVQVRDDGTFTVRLNMPDRRQVIPMVAHSHDGLEQRTIVLAIERNTKRMETVVRDAMD